MNRRQFLAGAAGLLAGRGALTAAPNKPNIVFILLDDAGTYDLGCYGQKHIQTPAADRVAAEGMRFTQAYAGAPVCAPSRAVLMTGLHGGHAPVRANAGTIPILAEDVILPELLKRAGYTSGAFGKWSLGDFGTTGVPWKHGVDEFFGYLHQTHAHTYYPEFLWDNDRRVPLPGNANKGRKQYSADLIADRSVEFIRKNGKNPFFLYATWTIPHAYFEVPDLGPYEAKDWDLKQKTYAAMMTRADGYVARILATLKEMGLERNTVVVLASDNGAPGGEDRAYSFFRSNGDLRGVKGTVYEGGIRVPFLVRWPGRVKPGSVSSYPTTFADLLPTFVEIAGSKPPSGIDGLSIVPELTGKQQPERGVLYWEQNAWDRNHPSGLRQDRLMQAVRMGDWKGVRLTPGGPLELYNLKADPSETRNVAAQHPDVVGRIEDWIRKNRTAPRPHNTGSPKWVR